MKPHFDPKTTFLVALLLSALAGLGVASAQLIQPSPTRAVGVDCSDWPEGQACADDQLCIDATVTKVCSSYCTSDADCTEDGWICRPLVQGNGETVSFCAPSRVLANP
jgi:hypothetical protein